MKRTIIAALFVCSLFTAFARTAHANTPLQYHGGPVLASFRIYPVYYGQWSQADMTGTQAYLNGLATYMSGKNAPAGQTPMMWQYGINNVTVAPYVAAQPTASPVTFYKGAITYIISDLQSRGQLPAYDRKTLIVVFLAHGFAVAENNGGAYHSSVSQSGFWAVVPQDAGVGTPAGGVYPFTTAPYKFQLVTGHEIFEAAADPGIDSSAKAWDEAVDGCPDGLPAYGGTWIQMSFGWIPGATDNTLDGACSSTGYSISVKNASGNWTRGSASGVFGQFFPPITALAGGVDTYGRTTLYTCRARMGDGSVVPGSSRAGSSDGCVTSTAKSTAFDYLVSGWEGNMRDGSTLLFMYTAGEVPQNAIQGGSESTGEPLYYCHAQYNGTWQPGKIRPGFAGCNVPYGGLEHVVSRYQVLVDLNPSMPYNKVSAQNGVLPADAVKAGVDSDGENLYLCSASINGGTHPGKLKPSLGACLIPFGGTETAITTYSVLVARWAATSPFGSAVANFPAGHETSGEQTSACRVLANGGTLPGKYRPSTAHCHVNINGSEIQYSDFALLTNPVGR
jgi:hypothetical protein